MLQDFSSQFSLAFTIFGFIFSLAQYWLPVLLAYVFWHLWMSYVQLSHLSEIKWTLLEIRLPKTILKTPLAMEIVLSALHKTTGGNWFEQKWQGKLRAWFSLEIVSLGGDIHFFIRTTTSQKNFLEAQLYSQFPGIEVSEADNDYVDEVAYNYHNPEKSEWEVWGTEFALTKPDPYPIKTYVDYGLDQIIKKEEEAPFRIDPITPTIEYMASIGKDEQIWIQILARATGKRFRDPKSWFGGKRDWKSEAKDLIANMQKKGEGEKLSKSESEAISAIEREISKFGFDCGIRVMYLAKTEHFNRGATGGLYGIFKQYGSEALNGFYPIGTTDEEYPFKNYYYDIGKLELISVATMKRKMFKAYRDRGYFYAPHKNAKKPFILNTEELATIYHFPNGIETPGFITISSRKSEPPANLPV